MGNWCLKRCPDSPERKKRKENGPITHHVWVSLASYIIVQFPSFYSHASIVEIQLPQCSLLSFSSLLFLFQMFSSAQDYICS